MIDDAMVLQAWHVYQALLLRAKNKSLSLRLLLFALNSRALSLRAKKEC